MQITWCGLQGSHGLLVPFVALRKPDHCPRRFDLVAGMNHVLTSSAVNPNEDTRVPSSAIGHVGHCLMTPILELAKLSESHQPRPELPGRHALICCLAVVSFGAPGDETGRMLDHPCHHTMSDRISVPKLRLESRPDRPDVAFRELRPYLCTSHDLEGRIPGVFLKGLRKPLHTMLSRHLKINLTTAGSFSLIKMTLV